MNKKKKIAFAALVLLLLAGFGAGLLLTSSRRAPTEVVGNLSAKEVSEITSAVHRYMWRSTLPNYSWNTIKKLPGAILRNATAHISGIYGDHISALVLVANSKGKPPTGFNVLKLAKGWTCTSSF